MATSYRQDGPPKGGFGDVVWKKGAVSKVFGWKGYAFISVFCGANMYIALQARNFIKETQWMQKDARLGILPVLMAESDRVQLRRAKHNEEAEAAIMADVPGWVPGASVMHNDRYFEHSEGKRRDYANLYRHRGALKRYHEEVWVLPEADIY